MKTRTLKTSTLHLRLPPQDKARIEQDAERLGVSTAAIVRLAVRSFHPQITRLSLVNG